MTRSAGDWAGPHPYPTSRRGPRSCAALQLFFGHRHESDMRTQSLKALLTIQQRRREIWAVFA